MTRDGRIPLLLVASVVLAMGLVIGNAVIYDAGYLLAGDRFSPAVEWGRLLSEPYWYQGLWRPATLLFLGVQVWLGGGIAPMLLHGVSLLLYVVTALLLWRTAIALGAPPLTAFLVALLFGVHPVHVEVVASVVGQAELLTALAMLGALVLWHRAAERGASTAIFLGLIALQFLAAGAKEQGYLLTALLAGQQLLLPARLPTRTAAKWLLVLLVIAILLWLIRANTTGSLAGETPAAYLVGLSTPERVLAALGAIPHALRLLVFPLHLGQEYSPPMLPVDGRFGWLQAGGLAILLLAATAFLRSWRSHPRVAFGLWWSAVTWVPASSLLVPAGLLLADRVLFLPSIGLAIALTGVMPELAVVRWRTLALATGALAVALAVRSAVRVRDWRSADVFYAAATRDTPNAYRAWFVRAMHENTTGRSAQAEASLRQALALWPRVPVVYEELGQLLRANGRCEEAIPIFREGLALDTTRTQLRARWAECERAGGEIIPN